MTIYYVWCPDYGQTRDDARSVEGYDKASAAAEWARDYERRHAEYRIASGAEQEVLVSDGDSAPARVVIFGESEPVYYARTVK